MPPSFPISMVQYTLASSVTIIRTMPCSDANVVSVEQPEVLHRRTSPCSARVTKTSSPRTARNWGRPPAITNGITSTGVAPQPPPVFAHFTTRSKTVQYTWNASTATPSGSLPIVAMAAPASHSPAWAQRLTSLVVSDQNTHASSTASMVGLWLVTKGSVVSHAGKRHREMLPPATA